MRMIPLLISDSTKTHTELAIKYFIPQALGSIIIIAFSSLELLINSKNIFIFSNPVIIVALIIKMGGAPLHFWFPQIIIQINYPQISLLLTWQKIAPLFLLSYFINRTLLILFVVARRLVGRIGGLNQTSLKIILTYSSIVHARWIIALTFISPNYFLLYMIIYAVITLNLLRIFHLIKINSVLNFKPILKISKLLISFSILSIGGLPPFLGFFIKLAAVNLILLNYSTTLSFILVITSLISLFYYFKVIYNFLLGESEPSILTNKFKSIDSRTIFFCWAVRINIITPILVLLT